MVNKMTDMSHRSKVRESLILNETSCDEEETTAEKNSVRLCRGSFRLAITRSCTGTWCFLVVLMLYTLVQATALLGIFLLVLPQIEKRFNLSATEVGLMAGANDIAALLFGVFISYYGDFANKIKWISFGGFVTATGLSLFTLPHFIAGRYVPPATVDYGIRMCALNATQNECPEGSAVDWYYMAIFCISQFIAGAGVLPIYSMTPAYFEENFSKKLTPIYIGLWNLSVVCGSLLGFALSDPLSSLYVDITQPEGVSLTSDDPRWIGNWWIGFLISAGLLALFSAMLLAFPKYLKSEKGRAESTKAPAKETKRKSFISFLKQFLISSKELMRNPVFVCNCLALNIPWFVMEGISPFVVKILLVKYGISVANVGKAMVISSVPGIVFGSLIGSVIVSKFDLKNSLKKSALVCIIGQILFLCGPLAFLIPGCGNANLAGLNSDYGETFADGSGFHHFSKSSKFLQSSCNNECGCSLQGFLPLCGSDNISYLDPCHAGCTAISSFEPLVFSNCSCVAPSTFPNGGSAGIGFCDRGCQNWEWFLLLMGFNTVFFFLYLIPSKIVVLRCVQPKQQAFAIGMQYISMKVMANIPGPIVMGKVIDRSCEIWQNLCGKAGSCSVYDVEKMNLTIVVIFIISIILAVIFFFISWWHCGEVDVYNKSTVKMNVPILLENQSCTKETSI